MTDQVPWSSDRSAHVPEELVIVGGVLRRDQAGLTRLLGQRQIANLLAKESLSDLR